MTVLSRLDELTRTLEERTVGLVPADAYLLLARIILGFPLLMNGVGQIAMPGIMEDQMNMVGVSLAWKWPAILASLLGGLAILLGWRVRLAAVLLIVYVIPATLLFHGTQNLVTGDDPLEVPELAIRLCQWQVTDFKGVTTPVSADFLRGCGFYRLWFDGAKTMDHFTMLIPALLLLAGAGAGHFSLDRFFSRNRKA